MKDLKVTIAGTVYTAPAPRVKEFKEYLKMLRDREENGADYYNVEFAFIASLFRDPAVTPETLDEADLAVGASLWSNYALWIDQYIPNTEKNAKSR